MSCDIPSTCRSTPHTTSLPRHSSSEPFHLEHSNTGSRSVRSRDQALAAAENRKMADFASASLWIKICMIIIPLSGLVHLIGFASPYWTNTPLSNNGLWKLCTKFQSRCYDYIGDNATPGWLRSVQFFETGGLIAIAVAAIILFLSLCLQSLRNKKLVSIINAIVCFAATGCIFLGIVIYGAQDAYNDYLSWAFVLCVIGGVLVGVAGVLILVGSLARS